MTTIASCVSLWTFLIRTAMSLVALAERSASLRERAVAEALDLLRDGLHLAADPLHALQAVAHDELLGGEGLAQVLRLPAACP
jgi:hypothetical protein